MQLDSDRILNEAPFYRMCREIPAHIPPELIFEYDVYRPGPPGSDYFEELYKLKAQAPPVFWTPYNGGHWFTTDSALTNQVLHDNIRFSSQTLLVPPENNPPLGRGFSPIHLDPPEHAVYRKLMQRALSNKTVTDMMPGIRAAAIELIETLKPRRSCDFVADFAFQLPTAVFLRLVDLPESYHAGVKSRVTGIVDAGSDKGRLFAEIADHLAPFVQERAQNPGTDLISWMSRQEVDGAPVTLDRLHSMTTLMLIAGLDTVANTFGFIARFLADHPDHRNWIHEHPRRLDNAREEMLRRFPVVIAGTARLCVEPAQIGPAAVAANDQIIAVPAMMNFDEATFPDPLRVDFERRIPSTCTFGQGPHRCLGASLARVQLNIFIEEWLARIPDFRVSRTTPPQFEPGVTASYDRLMLEW
jgi:cytochrome P450